MFYLNKLFYRTEPRISSTQRITRLYFNKTHLFWRQVIDCCNLTIFLSSPVISFHPLPLFYFKLCLIFPLPVQNRRGRNVNLIPPLKYCVLRVAPVVAKEDKRKCTETCKLTSKPGFFRLCRQAKSSKWHTTDSFRLYERVCEMMEGLKTYSEVLFSVPSIEIIRRASC